MYSVGTGACIDSSIFAKAHWANCKHHAAEVIRVELYAIHQKRALAIPSDPQSDVIAGPNVNPVEQMKSEACKPVDLALN